MLDFWQASAESFLQKVSAVCWSAAQHQVVQNKLCPAWQWPSISICLGPILEIFNARYCLRGKCIIEIVILSDARTQFLSVSTCSTVLANSNTSTLLCVAFEVSTNSMTPTTGLSLAKPHADSCGAYQRLYEVCILLLGPDRGECTFECRSLTTIASCMARTAQNAERMAFNTALTVSLIRFY